MDYGLTVRADGNEGGALKLAIRNCPELIVMDYLMVICTSIKAVKSAAVFQKAAHNMGLHISMVKLMAKRQGTALSAWRAPRPGITITISTLFKINFVLLSFSNKR